MTGVNPIFIDQFGNGGDSTGGNGPNWELDTRPLWKLAWQGKVPLWRAFWVYFVMGHGVILGLGCGTLLFILLAGFFFGPSSTWSGATGLAVIGTLVTLVFLIFAIWAVVAVWRCANNCTNKIRGIYARALMIGYVSVLALPLVKYVTR